MQWDFHISAENVTISGYMTVVERVSATDWFSMAPLRVSLNIEFNFPCSFK
ncbi:hypothetical protein ADICYQ_1201 [Cyclobacterium qasimii M12-11B]|uniref:Uncharacterized protein n=1 Tax=Cyclobacterium qasimii M12-11B TaxID=641524 RepID=S7VK33_9BACT|nr:hypothetical protein ADICYQ_1201 [Cyclobacterium qasimii M12-11B]